MQKLEVIFSDTNILVVDDYYVNQELTKDMLELLGCTVDIASNGLEAIEMYKKNKYALIFMDIQMPEMDGFAATKIIRASEENFHIPIIAITAGALAEDRAKCLNVGMDDYISKPIKGENLKTVLEKFVKQK